MRVLCKIKRGGKADVRRKKTSVQLYTCSTHGQWMQLRSEPIREENTGSAANRRGGTGMVRACCLMGAGINIIAKHHRNLQLYSFTGLGHGPHSLHVTQTTTSTTNTVTHWRICSLCEWKCLINQLLKCVHIWTHYSQSLIYKIVSHFFLIIYLPNWWINYLQLTLTEIPLLSITVNSLFFGFGLFRENRPLKTSILRNNNGHSEIFMKKQTISLGNNQPINPWWK